MKKNADLSDGSTGVDECLLDNSQVWWLITSLLANQITDVVVCKIQQFFIK